MHLLKLKVSLIIVHYSYFSTLITYYLLIIFVTYYFELNGMEYSYKLKKKIKL
jgi:hypothetical protein